MSCNIIAISSYVVSGGPHSIFEISTYCKWSKFGPFVHLGPKKQGKFNRVFLTRDYVLGQKKIIKVTFSFYPIFMYVHMHCFKCRFFHFCVLESCSTQSAQFTSMYQIFISSLQPYILRSMYILYRNFFYLQMYRTFSVAFYTRRNIAAYLP